MRSLYLRGVRVDDVTYDEALELILRFIQEGGPHLVTTPNPEFVMAAQRHAAFRQVLNAAALNIPDGIGLLLGARLLGQRIREHVRGTDLVYRLMERCAQAGHRVFLLGAAEGVAAEAARALRRRYPDLQVAGTFAGSPRQEADEAVRRRIAKSGPVHVILVAYGAPAQELWLARNLPVLGIPVGIGVGGVFNYMAGRAPRAPRLVQRLELEWLYRLLTQPWRWRRQIALIQFGLLMLRQAILYRVGLASSG